MSNDNSLTTTFLWLWKGIQCSGFLLRTFVYGHAICQDERQLGCGDELFQIRKGLSKREEFTCLTLLDFQLNGATVRNRQVAAGNDASRNNLCTIHVSIAICSRSQHCRSIQLYATQNGL